MTLSKTNLNSLRFDTKNLMNKKKLINWTSLKTVLKNTNFILEENILHIFDERLIQNIQDLFKFNNKEIKKYKNGQKT